MPSLGAGRSSRDPPYHAPRGDTPAGCHCCRVPFLASPHPPREAKLRKENMGDEAAEEQVWRAFAPGAWGGYILLSWDWHAIGRTQERGLRAPPLPMLLVWDRGASTVKLSGIRNSI